MQLKKGDQKLDIDEEWLPLRHKMQDALVGEMHDAHIAVAWLALSCGRWAKSNATGMKLSHTAISMFGELMFIPKIFDAPIILSNVDIAGISLVATQIRFRLPSSSWRPWDWCRRNKVAKSDPSRSQFRRKS